ncbi:hypothetical protein [Marinobacter sp. HN1S83]|uniref:hypothetical protein n=1 Tax=Marinobacter sp. HN1S83 TaxID=3382301 RepID=UPI00387AD44F
MSYYCPNCGAKLSPVTIKHDLWMQFFRCGAEECEKTFAKVVDMRNDYPLIEVFPNIPEKVNALSAAGVGEAWNRVNFVDYKTVSLVDFEEFLLSS